MTLFFVGVVEMIIAAYWTKFVAKENAPATGMVTMVNIFIWYYVIRVVVNDLGDWTTIVPYALGCALGSMIGAIGGRRSLRTRSARKRAKGKRTSPRRLTVEEAAVLSTETYEPL